MLDAFLARVKEQAPGVVVRTGPMDRWAYARDASPETFLERRHGVVAQGPAAVLWPSTDEEVVTIVKLAAEHHVPITPFGAGSGVVHGTEPQRESIVVDMKRFDALHIDAERREATVGAGMLGERFERALNAAGYSAGHFPSSIYCSTVGGWAAARSAGQLSSRYGKIEDMIMAIDAVDGTGRVLHAHRLDSHDLLRALIGSEGSLAIITRIRLRIHALPSHRTLFGLAAPDVDSGLTLMRKVMQAGLRPAVFRMYDPPDTVLAGGIPARSEDPRVVVGCIGRGGHEDPYMRGPSREAAAETSLFGMLSKRATAALRREVAGGRATSPIRAVVGSALSKTDWLRIPYSVLPTECLLVAGLEGDEDDVRESLETTLDIARECGVNMVGAAPGERWLRRRHAVTYKMPPFLRAGGWADTLEVAAPWSALSQLYLDARQAMLKHAVTLAHFSHAYPEGASIYFTLAGGHIALEEQQRAHRACVDDAMAVVARYNGALSHHHGVGRLKVRYLHSVLGAGAMEGLMQLKSTLDPANIMNPGVLGLGASA